MKNTILIAKREISSHINSFGFHLLLFFLFSIFSILAFNALSYFNYFYMLYGGYGAILNVYDNLIEPVLHNLSFLLLLFCPVLTMAYIAGERRQNTLELLFSLPLSPYEIVFGKFLAGISTLFFILLFSLYFTLSLNIVCELDYLRIFSGYLGLFLLCILFVSLGIFFSSLTQSLALAAIGSLFSSIVLWLLNWVSGTSTGFLEKFLSNLSITYHLNNLIKGIIDTRDILYFTLMSLSFLLLSTFFLEERRGGV